MLVNQHQISLLNVGIALADVERHIETFTCNKSNLPLETSPWAKMYADSWLNAYESQCKMHFASLDGSLGSR